MKYLLLFSLFVFSTASFACHQRTSQTKLSVNEIKERAKHERFVLCVDDKKFYNFQLKDMLKNRVVLRLLTEKVDFYNFEIKDFAKIGRVILSPGKKKNYNFEIKDFLTAGAHVRMRHSLQNRYTFEYKDFAKVARDAGSRFVLIVDNDDLYDFEIRDLRESGVIIRDLRD